MARELRGGADVRRLVTGHLEATFATTIATTRELHGLASAPAVDGQPDVPYLPDVAVYLDHQPLEIGKFPTINIASARLTGMRRVDLDDGDTPEGRLIQAEFVSAYDIEISGWVSARWDHVFDMRDDLIGAIRRHFLTTPAFAVGDDDELVVAEEIGMAEDKGDVIAQTGGLWGLAGSVAFTLLVPESITRPQIGTVLQTAVIVHPALAD